MSTLKKGSPANKGGAAPKRTNKPAPKPEPEPAAAEVAEPEAPTRGKAPKGSVLMQSPDGRVVSIVTAGVRSMTRLGWKEV